MSEPRKPVRPRHRRLSDEEVTLWVEVARTITPKSGARLPALSTAGALAETVPEPSPVKKKRPKEAPQEPPARMEPPKLSALPLAPIERRLRQRLSRGHIDVDMRIDLHGMRQDEAHAALRHFLARARQNQALIVLVVTGKGKGKVERDQGHFVETGVLRRSVPHWLSAPDLRQIVLGFEEASPTHGGGGALYVRLRSARRAGATPS